LIKCNDVYGYERKPLNPTGKWFIDEYKNMYIESTVKRLFGDTTKWIPDQDIYCVEICNHDDG